MPGKGLGVGARKENGYGRLGIKSRMRMLKRKSRLFSPSVKIYANMTITYGYHGKQARFGKKIRRTSKALQAGLHRKNRRIWYPREMPGDSTLNILEGHF
jgi:hypothetical protein